MFLVTFGVYLYSACPTVAVGDSGEFITSAITLGLPHAPSFPVYCLLGKLFSVLIPWGNFAFRVNLFSAIAGALTISFIYLCGRGMGLSRVSSLAGAMVLGFSTAFFRNSLVAEVFALNSLFAAMLLYFSLQLTTLSSQRSTFLLAFILGLGLGNHQTLILILPSLIIAGYKNYKLQIANYKFPISNFQFPILSFLFFLLGFSIYISLPLRAVKVPPLNWGNPVTVEQLYRTITRKDYGSFTLALGSKPERSPANTARQLKRFTGEMWREITPYGSCLVIPGLLFMWKRNRVMCLSLLVWLMLTGPVFLTLGNLPFDAQSNGVLDRFLIFPIMAAVIFIAYGIEFVGSCPGLQKKALGYVLAAFLTAVSVIYSRSEFSWRRSLLALDYGRNIFRSLLPGSTLFMDGGDDTFYTTAYLHFVEGLRRDVKLFDRGGLVFSTPYGPDFRGLDKSRKEVRRQEVERSKSMADPVFYSTMERNILVGGTLHQEGFLYLVTAIDGMAAPFAARTYGNNLWEIYRFRGLYPVFTKDYRSRALAPYFPFMRAVSFENKQDAFNYLLRAGAFGWDIPWLNDNLNHEIGELAYYAVLRNDLELAGKLYNELLRHNPDDAPSLLNLGVVYERKGDMRRAKEFYRRSVAADPHSVDAHYNLAVALWREGDWKNVISELDEVLRINPAHEGARRYIVQAVNRQKSRDRSQKSE